MGETYKCRDDVFLHAEKISKIYPGTKALDEVSFDLLRGKVNVLIGAFKTFCSCVHAFLTGYSLWNEGTHERKKSKFVFIFDGLAGH